MSVSSSVGGVGGGVKITLYHHPSYDGLPSWRPSSLSVITLFRFHNIPFTSVDSNNDSMSPCGELPLVKYGPDDDQWAVDHMQMSKVVQHKILPYLHLQNTPSSSPSSPSPSPSSFFCDSHLSAHEALQVEPWKEICESRLKRCLLCHWWLDSLNRPLIESRSQLPFAWPFSKQSSLSYVRHLAWHATPLADDLDETLALLAKQIHSSTKKKKEKKEEEKGKEEGDGGGNKDDDDDEVGYLLDGYQPCSADAILFAYLCVMLYVPLPSATMRTNVMKYPVLVQYTNKILRKYHNIDPTTLPAAVYPDEATQDNHPQHDDTTMQEKARAEVPALGPVLLAPLVRYGVYAAVAIGVGMILLNASKAEK